MIYLLLAIFCSALIPNIFRLGKSKKVNEPIVITMNYFLASCIILGYLLISKQIVYLVNINNSFDIKQSLILAVFIGIITGFCYYGGFYYYQKAVRISGASLASAFGKLGILIPMVLSVVLWKEYPSRVQLVGIVLALISIFIVAINIKDFKLNDIHPILIVFFFIGGLGDFSNKIFQKYCMLEHNDIFLFFIFFTALMVSILGSVKIKRRGKWDYIIGIIIGIPNMLTSYFLIQALTQKPAVVVFPIFSGGTIILASTISAIAFKERLKGKEYVALLLILVAVFLIN